ncbi:hypothetical protein D0C36_05125 [Mucilaginibacter conchicola]|uniref:Uncharacterized protein n=1 Tax=Mucilaginibacter conchicola TaxID=2303333 RepID=A0A372NYD4_9SPHI|nr:hypothetical protein [Mucilaginibacter conchicola]RFZ94914.1 hypothetical protein D0C36_05125 [Mucilaginibacter conchicola]
MRWWIKVLFGLILAVKLTPSVAQHRAVKSNDDITQQEQNKDGKDHLNKPMQPGEGCLVEERSGQQIQFLFRWPIQLLKLSSYNSQTLSGQLITQWFRPLSKVPLQHFYRTLLFPFHSNT